MYMGCLTSVRGVMSAKAVISFFPPSPRWFVSAIFFLLFKIRTQIKIIIIIQ